MEQYQTRAVRDHPPMSMRLARCSIAQSRRSTRRRHRPDGRRQDAGVSQQRVPGYTRKFLATIDKALQMRRAKIDGRAAKNGKRRSWNEDRNCATRRIFPRRSASRQRETQDFPRRRAVAVSRDRTRDTICTALHEVMNRIHRIHEPVIKLSGKTVGLASPFPRLCLIVMAFLLITAIGRAADADLAPFAPGRIRSSSRSHASSRTPWR